MPLHGAPLALQERLYTSAKDYFEDLLHAISESRHSIDLEVYILSDDELGRRFLDALHSAASRGVRVRILLDAVGSYFWIKTKAPDLKESPLQIQIYHPLPSISELFKLWPHINRRNHRKSFVIDKKTAFVGSMNLCMNSFKWQEIGACTQGPAAKLVQRLFDDTWTKVAHSQGRYADWNLAHELAESPYLLTNQSLRLRRLARKRLLRKIHGAKRRVWLMTPYFVPPPALMSTLAYCAQRGVDVRLVMPRLSDIKFIPWIARLHYHYLLRAGVKLYEYNAKFIHAKAGIIDDWAMIGSTNLNHRSFFQDLELDLILHSKKSIADLEILFKSTFLASENLKQYNWRDHFNIVARLLFMLRAWF